MPWCPKCGTEYRDGFDTCADCREALRQNNPSTFRSTQQFTGSGHPLAQLATVWLLLTGVTFVLLITHFLELILVAMLISFCVGYIGGYWFCPRLLPAAWLVAVASVLVWNAIASAVVAPRSIGFAIFIAVISGLMTIILGIGVRTRNRR